MILDVFKETVRSISPVTDIDCEIFEPYLKYRTLAKHDFFAQAGQTCREIGFIYKGLFRIYHLNEEGKEINTHFFMDNDFVSLYPSFLHQKPANHYAQALEDSELVILDYETLQKAYAISHRWSEFGRKVAEACYLEAIDRIESFHFLSGEERYLQLQASHPHYFERIPLYHIASYLGLERESLSRLRRKLAQHG